MTQPTQAESTRHPTAETSAQFDLPAIATVARPVGLTGRVTALLASWRAMDRELHELPENSPDRPRLLAVVAGLRAAYHRSFAEHRNDPTEF